jgi:hypothetical protein
VNETRTRTDATQSGFPTPNSSHISPSIRADPACNTSTSCEAGCPDVLRRCNNVRLHQSTLDWNPAGFDCFWAEKSEYMDFKRELETDLYVGYEVSGEVGIMEQGGRVSFRHM